MKRICLFMVSLWVTIAAQALSVSSPNGNVMLNFEVKNGKAMYALNYKDKAVVYPSALGIELKNQPSLVDSFRVVSSDISSFDETWKPVWGEQKEIRNNYTQLLVNLEQGSLKRQMSIEFRLFNDGLGFRYIFPNQKYLTAFIIAEEKSNFNLGYNYKAFWIPGDYDTNEYNYNTTKLSEIRSTMPNAIEEIPAQTPIETLAVQTPLMLVGDNGLYVNIHEAALIDYPAMNLEVNDTTFTLASHLVPNAVGDKGIVQTEFATPWRTILVSDKATDILASKTILNLNEPNTIENTDWIKPTKYIGVWWEMFVPNGSTWAYSDSSNVKIGQTDFAGLKPNGRHAANTENVKKYIDFASKNGFDAVLVEGWNIGWEDWFGVDKENVFDFVTPYPDFDVKALEAYAKEKGVKLIMHHETSASVSNYERRMEDAYDFMKENGYDAVKSGYVGSIIPYGEHHYGQSMVNHYLHAIQKGADKEIMINAHEPVRPTGLHRTYPNFLASESGRGTEYEALGYISPDHQTIMPFTRLMGGPMDYTPGIFQTDLSYYDPTNTNRINTTLAKQLALYVTMYSPLQMAADLPENYERFPDAFTFIKNVPVDWDATEIIEAEPGDYITIARKEKNSENWYIGGVTDENARTASFSLGFLTPGKQYMATIYQDGKTADYEKNPQSYTIRKERVNSNTKLKIHLARSGGFAIEITPIAPKLE